MKLSKVFMLFWSLCLLTSHLLEGEIERITIKWDPGQCQLPCIRDLQKQFSLIPGVAEMVLNEPQAQADLRWKPRGVTFSFSYINSAMRTAGPRFRDVRISVRGVIRHVGSQIVLESLGDNTQFILIGPVQGNPAGYIERFNIDSHPLNPVTRQQLLEAERFDEVVSVEGALFQPERIVPLYLITENVTYHNLGTRQ